MMQTRQGYTGEALRAVQQFLADNEPRLGAIADSGARQRLDQIITELEAHATEQVVGTIERQMATQIYHARRGELVRLHMAAIMAAARLEAPRIPALAALHMPRGNISVAKLASEAMGMATIAASHEAVFIAAGLPANFVEELREVARAMADARGEHVDRRAAVGGATKGIRTMLTTGRRLVALLDKLIRRAAYDDAPLLLAWESVKRAHRIGRPASRLAIGPGRSVTALGMPEAPRQLSAGESAVESPEQGRQVDS